MAKVLVVDDEEAIVWSFRRMLEGMGHDCLAAGSGEHAVFLALRESPDLVILDVTLPGIDGLSALEQMRRARPDGRYLVMSARCTLPTTLRAHRLGAADCLVKPLDLDAAREHVRALLVTK